MVQWSTSVSGAGASTVAASQVAAAVGILVALLVAWSGPGGASVAGVPGALRGLVRGEPVTAAVILCIVAGLGRGRASPTRRAIRTFGPLHQLPLGDHPALSPWVR